MNLKALLHPKTLFNEMPKSVKLAILIVVATKILILTLGYVTNYINIARNGPADPLTVLLTMFNRWDSDQYMKIAHHWYINAGDDANLIAFFPLFPLLIKAFTFNYTYDNLTGMIIANICSIIAFLYLYKLAKLEFNSDVAVKAVLFLSIFPTAYFLAAPYTEALFFALVLACLYYARTGKWEISGSLSFLAALTRLAGLLLIPVLLLEYYHQAGWKLKKTQLTVIWTLPAAIGFLIYLGINQQTTGNAFTFLEIQQEHFFNTFNPWGGLSGSLYYGGASSFPGNLTWYASVAFAAFGLAMIGLAISKRLRPVYTLYLFLFWGFSVGTSWWISVPRYIMAMVPMFMLLGVTVNKKIFIAIFVVVSAAFMCYFEYLFTLGMWAF